ncbi:ABC transporter permease [uncultured Paraglaciecola sp.]|uniref:ABC transporter permease n=1 Tax=uncultured Paraglaciecola sp. TaxID=1765024 RepID=UPI0030D8E061|tara:strand:+ start:112729 stop:113967 length:1239 start_codon:yes stop_codon:yes gene_type:complete
MKMSLEISESFKIALNALTVNKARGALTALGIIIGIVAVIVTMTAANGLQISFRESFASVGSDVIYVSQRPWVQNGPWFRFRNRPPITLEASERLQQRLQGQGVVNPSMGQNQSLKNQNKVIDNARVIGTTDKQTIVSNMLPETGRFLMPFDVAYKKQVVVIGSEIATGLFEKFDPIGQDIKVGRYKFKIIGVMEEQGGSIFGGPNFDRQVFIPITTYNKVFGNSGGRANVDIAIKAPSPDAMEDFEYQVIGEMRKIRGLKPIEEDDFAINKLGTLLDAYNSIMGVVVAAGLGITSISLFVGGVGVMNIMFVSVTERTKEIGIRKAIGARRRNILMQFLFEALLICLFAGILGLSIAAAITEVINQAFLPASLSPAIIIAALVISMFVGIVSGFVPAYRGANLDPIEALRYE